MIPSGEEMIYKDQLMAALSTMDQSPGSKEISLPDEVDLYIKTIGKQVFLPFYLIYCCLSRS